MKKLLSIVGLLVTSHCFGAGLVNGTLGPVPFTGTSIGQVGSQVYYVNPSGSDSANGSVVTPFASLAFALSSLPSGSTLIASGIYNQTNNVYIPRNCGLVGVNCVVTNWSTNTDNASSYTNPGALFNMNDNTLLSGMRIYAGYKGLGPFQYHAGLVGTN